MTSTLLSSALSYKLGLLGIMLGSWLCKLIFLALCSWYFVKLPRYRAMLSLLLIFLSTTLINDFPDILGIVVRKIMEIKGWIPVYSFIHRIGWAVKITQFQSLALFLEHLAAKKIKLSILHVLACAANLIISGTILYLAFFYYNVSSRSSDTLPFEMQLDQMIYVIIPLLFIQPAIVIYKKIRNGELPHILRHQIKVGAWFTSLFIGLTLLNSSYFFLGSLLGSLVDDNYFFYALTGLLVTIGLYIMGRKMIGLRFLNVKSAVAAKDTFNLLSRCADILENIKYATAVKELAHLTRTFFQSAFAIPLGQTRLYLSADASPSITDNEMVYDPLNSSSIVEKAFQEQPQLLESLSSSNLFMRDELEFTQYYQPDPQRASILSFLDACNADIFVPIYEHTALIAYIIVERDARPHTLFTNKERDEMLIFTTYISNIMIILKNKSVEELRFERKQLNDELFHKHQEIAQYKESIRSFLRAHKERKMGIIFYKNRRFTIANEAGHDLIGFDINTQEGHPLTQALKTVTRRVEDYKAPQSAFSYDAAGNKIVISGLTTPDQTVILLIHYPEIADLIKDQFIQLQDPSRWDYILYLETTKSGKIVDALLPGRSAKILSYKIDLLAAALSKKAVLLHMNEEDLLSTVEILHSISLRDTFHSMVLLQPEQHNEYAVQLCGLNPLLGETTPSLLEKCAQGTLFIRNIEMLSLATQEVLARALATGTFQKGRSSHMVPTDVRVLCTSQKDLKELVQEGTFSRSLYEQLHETTLSMPSLHDLSEGEITELADGFAHQMLPSSTSKQLLTLSQKDRASLTSDRPTSMTEFKQRVHDALQRKSEKLNIGEFTSIDPAYNEPNPAIAQAIRLGKKALKDPQVMALLWNKFRNQNKIATLLGVNRSSVNRRCQEYNLK